MSVNRTTEIFENVTQEEGVKTLEAADYDTNVALRLTPSAGGFDGFTAQGIVTTTENILTTLSPINISTIHYPTSAQKLWFASTSAQDNATGTGASIIAASGLDSAWNIITELITLDGQTPVESTSEFIRLNAMYVVAFGSGNVMVNGERRSAGNIYAGGDINFTGGVPDLPIIGIDGTSDDTFRRDIANRESIYSVPDGFFFNSRGYMLNCEATKSVEANMYVRFFGEDFFRKFAPVTVMAGENFINFGIVFPIPPRTDIQLRAKTTVGSSYTTSLVAGALYKVG